MKLWKAIFPGAMTVNLAVMGIGVSRLPASVPVHFNSAFVVDRMGSPLWLAILPVLSLACSLGMLVKSKRHPKNARAMSVSLTGMALVFLMMGWALYAACSTGAQLGDRTNAPIDLVICLSLTLLFVVIGNYLPTLQERNHTFGIRTRATLSSDEVWRKVHRFCGMVYAVSGLLGAVAVLIGYFAGMPWLELAAELASVLVSSVISVLYARKCGKETL